MDQSKMKKILHVDMNSFFASCEQAVNPKLKNKKVAVAGDPKKRHGIILAASYEAKACGVSTTMPIWKAEQVCPDLICVGTTMELYSEYSRRVMEIFDDFTPVKEQLSIDEAFLDMTGMEEVFGNDIVKIASDIQQTILIKLDLPCSVGISENKLLAKMGSDYKKPMGITEIYKKDVEIMLWKLDVNELYGAGKKTTKILNDIGIYKIGDLAKSDINTLKIYLGNKSAEMLKNYANGIDDREVIPGDSIKNKSIGKEFTFPEDTKDKEYICNALLKMSDIISYKCRKKKVRFRTVSIKIKYSNFSVITRSMTLEQPANISDELYKYSKELFLKNYNNTDIRLIGISVSNFQDKTFKQISLLEQKIKDEKDIKKKESFQKAIDEIKERYGNESVKRAKFLDR